MKPGHPGQSPVLGRRYINLRHHTAQQLEGSCLRQPKDRLGGGADRGPVPGQSSSFGTLGKSQDEAVIQKFFLFCPHPFHPRDTSVAILETTVDRDNDTEREVLKWIAAMLIALAVLADRSCDRSSLVRSLVLWFLRHAEGIARDFVIGEAQACGVAMPDLPPAISFGDSVGGAMRLAASFRLLALVLQSLPVPSCDVGGFQARLDGLLGDLARTIPGASALLIVRRPPLYDTS